MRIAMCVVKKSEKISNVLNSTHTDDMWVEHDNAAAPCAHLSPTDALYNEESPITNTVPIRKLYFLLLFTIPLSLFAQLVDKTPAPIPIVPSVYNTEPWEDPLVS